MEIVHYEEHKDGSATIQVIMELEEREKLIEIGLITALKKFIEKHEDGDNT